MVGVAVVIYLVNNNYQKKKERRKSIQYSKVIQHRRSIASAGKNTIKSSIQSGRGKCWKETPFNRGNCFIWETQRPKPLHKKANPKIKQRHQLFFFTSCMPTHVVLFSFSCKAPYFSQSFFFIIFEMKVASWGTCKYWWDTSKVYSFSTFGVLLLFFCCERSFDESDTPLASSMDTKPNCRALRIIW